MKNENYMQSLVGDGNIKQTKLYFKADDLVLSIDPSLCNTMISPEDQLVNTILPLDRIKHPLISL
jgi:hypothetical protein